MDIDEICELMTVLMIVLGLPLGLLYVVFTNRKQTKARHEEEQKTEEYTVENIPRLVEGNRDNVVQICVVIYKNWEERRTTKFPEDIGDLIRYNMQIYDTSDFDKIFSNIGNVLYEYLVVDKTTKETKEISGVTDNYYEIKNIIDEVKRH